MFMNAQTHYTEDGNARFQPAIMGNFMLGRSIAHQHTRALGSDPISFVERQFGTIGPLASFNALANEVSSKYAFGEMLRLLAGPMVYQRLGDTSSDIHLNVLAIFPMSLNFAHMVETKSLALWYAPIQHSKVIKESPKALGLKAVRFTKAINLHMQTSDVTHRASLTPMYLQNGGRETAIEHFNLQLHHIKVISAKELARAVIGTIQPVHFWHWLQQKRDMSISHLPSMTPTRLAQSLLQQEVISSIHYVLPSNGKTLMQGFQPAAIAVTRILTPLPESNVFAARHLPQSRYLIGTPQPPADKWFVPLIRQKFVEGKVSSTESVAANRPPDALQQFTVIRYAEHQEPPLLPYALAQQPRPTVQAAPVAAKVREQEVVSVVRQEMQAYMASGVAAKHLSRADYTRIAEHVYASLSRRLLVEKERLGLR
jgi:hypothetical protein